MTEREKSSVRYQCANAHLEAGRINAALEELRIIEAIEKIELHKQSALRDRAIPVVSLLTVFAITLGLVIKIPSTEIILTVESSGFRLLSEADDDSAIARSAIEGTGIRIDDTDYFDPLPINHPTLLRKKGEVSVNGAIDIQAASIRLGDLTITRSAEGASLVVDQYQSNIDFYIDGANLAGQLEFERPEAFTVSSEKGPRSLIAEGVSSSRYTRYFRTRPYGGAAIPHSIRFFNVRALDLAIEELASMSFSRQHPPGTGKTQSTVLGGNLLLLDTGDEFEIRASESLSFSCSDCSQHSIDLVEGRLMFSLRGSVTALDWGYRNRRQDRMPSVLLYLYHNQKIAMLWGTALFTFGIFWRLRRNF